MNNTLCDLGAFMQVGEAHSIDEVLAQCHIMPTYRNLLLRWLRRLVAARLLDQRPDGTFVAVQPLQGIAPDEVWRETRVALADVPFLLEYMERCTQALRGVLTGQSSPLETLFPGGSFATTEALYQDWAQARYFNHIVRAVVEGAAAAGDTLQVIEIGAGTGSTTSAVLPALTSGRATYTFTDVSEMFLDRARDKFKAYDFVRYGLLNAEQDPHDQGYARHGYDVAIAANVLHATHNLSETLANVQALLAPQGVLVLYEATRQQTWYDITTGLIEGWQRFDDEVRRDQDHPLLSPAQWERVLRGAGFLDVAIWPEAGSPAEVMGLHVIVARPPQLAVDAAIDAPAEAGEIEWGAVDQSGEPTPPTIALLDQLRSALPDERLELLIDFVRGHVARILRLDPNEPLDRRARLMDIGVDSLMAVELRSRLSNGLGLAQPLPATLIFDYPTSEGIARYLLNDVLKLDAAGPTLTVLEEPIEAGLTDLDEMSDDEVATLLLKKLKALS
jgi:SAM-dependent methyltransferase